MARTEPRRKYACHNGTDCTVTPDVSALGPGGVHDTADIAVVAAKNQVTSRIYEKKFGHGSVDKYYRAQQQEAGVQRDLRQQHRKGLLPTAALNKAAKQLAQGLRISPRIFRALCIRRGSVPCHYADSIRRLVGVGPRGRVQ